MSLKQSLLLTHYNSIISPTKYCCLIDKITHLIFICKVTDVISTMSENVSKVMERELGLAEYECEMEINGGVSLNCDTLA